MCCHKFRINSFPSWNISSLLKILEHELQRWCHDAETWQAKDINIVLMLGNLCQSHRLYTYCYNGLTWQNKKPTGHWGGCCTDTYLVYVSTMCVSGIFQISTAMLECTQPNIHGNCIVISYRIHMHLSVWLAETNKWLHDMIHTLVKNCDLLQPTSNL